MLQQIRDRSQSMIAKVIVGAVIVALALFGVESLIGLFTSGSDNVAEVNGEPITRQEVETEVQRAIRSGQVPPEQERELRNQVIEQLVSREVLGQYAEEGGLYASETQIDHMIVSLPEFQDQSGKFSQEIFRNRLASAGYTPLSFRQQLREDLIRQQVQQGLATSEFMLDSERERFVELQRQTRSFRYHVLTRDDLEDDIVVSEQELQSYYQTNQEQFRRPEQVRLAYVILDQANLAEDLQVDEQTLRDAYAEREREAGRRVSHIMVTFGDQRTREEARARLLEVKERLAAGENFADLAAEYSDDETTADSEGDLGFINRGFFGESFEDAAFSLEPGQVSDIVETDNGLHLIKVTDLDIPPFEEMRDTLREDVAMEQASDVFNEQAQRLIDESFAADDLASVAEDLGLELQQSDWVSRDGASGVLAEPGVMAAAFETDVLENGYNSEVLELDEQRRMVLRVTDHREATTLPLDEVQEQVRSAVEQEKVAEALRERAAEMAQALRNGDSLNLDWQQVDSVSRQQEAAVPQPILQQAFRLPRPEGSDPVYGQAVTPQGVALIALTDVEAGDVSADGQIDAFVVQMAERLRAQAAIQGLLETLRENADIERM
ncbi:SurA N-terminal domain-containing protein [Halomonas sp. McH1-25]|uniref:SurA N-terminal domain-containing protein n=1 Tax=unclassified Halomonas TaxID=2609666 RepID=UPI001EF543E1|nr:MULTISPECIES: SurA N-terminal domain-containing protein [unclassified Halomonas]MCG7598678.1 SurA N-terminal domain-containing protein [Halomonas sp. McH1-25]MCP1340641.1 SurA N-terminal domain-containing protein [Halomonas sp. FL8]MCP1359412.1 SurA N-terminal domain-containing protein [Halomonas sp. BBD45]